MKKYLTLAATAALVLAACAKIETSVPVNEADRAAINFTNYAPRSLAKADATYASGASLVVNKKFSVYSYATSNNTAFTSSAIGTQFMNGVDVTYVDNDANGAHNTYSPLRYWPSGDTPDWLTFWAYYPVQADNGITYTAPTGSNGVGSYAFTAASTAAAMVDFMVADVVNDKIYGDAAGDHVAVNGVVGLTFRHQLTKIAVKFKTDNEEATTNVVLTAATLNKVKTSGTLSTTYATGATTTSWGSQALAATPVVYDVTIAGAAINNNVLTTSPVGGADADLFLMIPQETIVKNGTNPQYFEISWDVKTYDTAAHATANGADGLLSTTSNTKKIYLDDIVLKDSGDVALDNNDWAKNQFTTYTITVGPKPIRFTATVAPWDAETFGNVSVN